MWYFNFFFFPVTWLLDYLKFRTAFFPSGKNVQVYLTACDYVCVCKLFFNLFHFISTWLNYSREKSLQPLLQESRLGSQTESVIASSYFAWHFVSFLSDLILAAFICRRKETSILKYFSFFYVAVGHPILFLHWLNWFEIGDDL